MGELIEVTSDKMAVVCAPGNRAEVEQLTHALLKAIGEWRGTVNPHNIADACVSVIATVASCLPAEMLQDMRDYTFDAMTTAVDAIEEERSTN
jgi:hypothetical protein